MLNKYKQDKDVLFLIAVVISNLAFIVSCLFEPSGTFLLISFLCEAAFLYAVKWQGVSALFNQFSLFWSLLKVSIYTYLVVYPYSVLPFLALEACLILFYKAGYFYKFFATSVPMRNFKNIGRLTEVRKLYERVEQFRKALMVRPLLYALLIFAILLNSNELMVFILLAVVFFTVWFAYHLFIQLRYLRSKAYKKDIVELVEKTAPQVLVYVSGAPGSSYQLSQWLPVLEKLKLKVMVVARELFWISELPENSLATVYARGMGDLENFISSKSRVCLYPANAFKNTQMMRQIQLRHIFINHGESDKIVNQSRFIRAYDKLYLAGPMAYDRLVGSGVLMEKGRVAYVGRPQTSIFIEPIERETMTILYAPTWEGFDKQSNYSSVGMALKIIKAITNETEYRCVFKPHPLTGTISRKLEKELDVIEKYLLQEKGEFVHSGNILELMNDCDLLITDISSVMNDFLCTGKPYIVTNPSHIAKNVFCETFPTAQGAYILNNANELSGLIREIADSDPKSEERSQIMRYSLGENPLGALQRFESELNKDCLKENL